MSNIIFSLPGNELLANALAISLQAIRGDVTFHHFPDKETYIKVNTDVQNCDVIIVATLVNPDEKILPLIFLIETLRELGARKIELLAPYLAYMRQDKRFKVGEAISSKYFGKLLSSYVDRLITVDPHLHRYKTLAEICLIPAKVITANQACANWIHQNIQNPLLIGPDIESKQWVAETASIIHVPYLILEKTRSGDHDVKVSVPSLTKYTAHTPVLVDDIISTGKTMMEAIKKIKKQLPIAPICVGVHAVFAENAYAELKQSGASQVITCNTIPHVSNGIDLIRELSVCF